tara:strand:- start:438 stop:866 length:429 start_codon:yes stop_codon:yes gene_type:complete
MYKKMTMLSLHYSHLTPRDYYTVRGADAYKEEASILCQYLAWEIFEDEGFLLCLDPLFALQCEDETESKLSLYRAMHNMIEYSKMSLAFVKILELIINEKCYGILVTDYGEEYNDLPSFHTEHDDYDLPVDGGKAETDDSAV